jgi:regulator of nonsense transcripts 2
MVAQRKLVKRCEPDRLRSGTLTDAREKGLADARELLESLQKSVKALSDALDQPMPQLEEEENDDAEGGGTGIELWTKGGDEEGGDYGPFDDEETRD